MCMMHGVRIHNMQGVFGVGAVCGVCVSVHKYHCATAFSMQSCAESAYQPYADEYH